MPYIGTKYDHTVCSTVKCNHGFDAHAANPFDSQKPRHCLAQGCRCGVFRPTPIRPSAPRPQAEPADVTEIDAKRRPSKPERFVRMPSRARSA